MIKVEGSYTFDAPREVVWDVLMDPQALAKALPGTQTLEEIGENQYRGIMVVRVGPVQGRFEGTVTLTDVRPLEGYHMQVSGKGPQGFLNGEGDLNLEEQDGKTVMTYTGQAQVGGRIAGVGQRLIDSTARSIIRQALDALNKQVQARATAQAAGATAEEAAQAVEEVEVSAPSTTQIATQVAKDVAADLIPPEKRPLVIGGGVVVLLVLVYLLSRLF